MALIFGCNTSGLVARSQTQYNNINTPINLELQKIATDSLRNGLISYDKRKGWRGPIKSKTIKKNWYNNLEKYEFEKSRYS